jgi:hypothetical protein
VAARDSDSDHHPARVVIALVHRKEDTMGFGRGLLLWLLGVPLPIIILLALFWHN